MRDNFGTKSGRDKLSRHAQAGHLLPYGITTLYRWKMSRMSRDMSGTESEIASVKKCPSYDAGNGGVNMALLT